MEVDPREIARKKFEQIMKEQKDANSQADGVIWAATVINAGLGLVPVGINIVTFWAVSTVMLVWLGKIYGQTLTDGKAGQMIKQIIYSIGPFLFAGIGGVKFIAEILKLAIGVFPPIAVAGTALDAVMMGGITYAIGFTSKELFKRNNKMSKEDIKAFFTRSFEEGKQRIKNQKR